MIDLGRLELTSQISVRGARRKVLSLARSLGFDEITATRLATATSELARRSFQESSAGGIGVALSEESNALVLQLETPVPSEFLLRFFDEVTPSSARSGAGGPQVRKRAGTRFVLDDNALEKYRELVQSKSRAELLEEVRAQNAQLEDHRARLEETVEERTTQLREAMAEAETANKAKSDFLANMSHELRTPMNAIIGYSEMLIEEAEDLEQEDFIPDLQKVRGAGKHLLALINDILDLSKIEAGKMELYCESFEIDSMIEDVASTVGTLVSKNNNTLELALEDDLGSMFADLTKVRQSLFNLLSNACKFTHEGSIVLAVSRSREDPEQVHFKVKDSGIGVAEDKLASLFDEFTQADASTTRNYGGTGLGLAITKRFCEMMGGSIDATSELGAGTTFIITIPAKVSPRLPESPLDKARRDEAIEKMKAAPREQRILVVDDDPQACELIERALILDGYVVVTVSEGEQALKLAAELRPAAITLDVIMPGMDGWSALQALKSDPATRDIPVIMISMVDDRTMGCTLGATEYLTKPLDQANLSRVLEPHCTGNKPGRVLVVEDDEPTREVMCRNLEKAGWMVDEAGNGQQGLVRVGADAPDLILLDLMMPVMDGFEFVVELRKTEAWRTIPVIVVTAKDLTPEDRQRLNGDVERILAKGGCDQDALLTQVRNSVATSKSG